MKNKELNRLWPYPQFNAYCNLIVVAVYKL